MYFNFTQTWCPENIDVTGDFEVLEVNPQLTPRFFFLEEEQEIVSILFYMKVAGLCGFTHMESIGI